MTARRKKKARRIVRKNPTPRIKTQQQLGASISLFRAFTGREPRFVDEYTMTVPAVGLEVGIVTGIMYRAKRDGKTEEYLHEFTGKSRPILAVSSDGRQMLMLGGNYQFTGHGIEDR